MPDGQSGWIGKSLGGRYQIVELLGEGSMSLVYKATDPNLRRTVAIKLIHSFLSHQQEFVQRFEEEAAAIAQLRHPNIIQVFDFNRDQGTYYMVLEHIPGETLRDRLQRLNGANKQLLFTTVAEIGADIADALAYAHGRGMIHRDVKPANIMLRPDGDAVLMDFGIAKILGGKVQTATGAIIGSAIYMAPEQGKDAKPTPKIDIYSLGVMLFEMVSGKPPFEGKSAITVLMKHANDPIPDLLALNPATPRKLKEITEKALAKNPEDRFSSADEMAIALREAIAQ
jgi:serine/threonine protein kinase